MLFLSGRRRNQIMLVSLCTKPDGTFVRYNTITKINLPGGDTKEFFSNSYEPVHYGCSLKSLTREEHLEHMILGLKASIRAIERELEAERKE